MIVGLVVLGVNLHLASEVHSLSQQVEELTRGSSGSLDQRFQAEDSSFQSRDSDKAAASGRSAL